MTAPTSAAAATAAYYALDAAYRAAVAQTALSALQIMMIEWQTVQPRNLAATSGPWLERSINALILAQQQARLLANSYTNRIRQISVPGAPAWTPPDFPEPNLVQLRKSLVYTGISTTAREIARVDAVENAHYAEPDDREEGEPADRDSAVRTADGARQRLMREAISRATAAAVRHVTAAGHDQLFANVNSDDVALGWYRTTKAGCCYFCAMLASRGRVYKKDSFESSNARFSGPGEQKVHDHCGCGLRPFYSDGDPMPERTGEFEKLWIDEAARFSGPEAVLKFRQAYEGRKVTA